MKNLFIKAVCLVSLLSTALRAQEQQLDYIPNKNGYIIDIKGKPTEKYGNTLNLGAGIGYYNNFGLLAPAAMLNYEVDIFKNFTLAPFVGASTFVNSYYWGNPSKPYYDPSYRYYNYRETIIPIGAKGTYYFDQWLRLNPKWDLYVATSIGVAFKTVVWDNGYYGDKGAYQNVNPLYVAMHVGGEYHFTKRVGLFLDLSTGISSVGLALHFTK